MRCLENGADVNAPTNDNCTPLMMASRSDNVRIINFLLKQGANVLKDRNGKQRSTMPVVRILLVLVKF